MPEDNCIPRRASAGRFRLGFQLLCILCVIAGIVALSAGFLIARGERSYIVALMDSEHNRKLELVIAATLDNLISEDVPQIETSMTQLIDRDPNVRKILLRNETGRTLYRYPKAGEAGRSAEDENLRTFRKDIVFEGEKFGQFTVVWDTGSIVREGRARAFKAALTIGGVCLFLGALVYLFIRFFMIWPIQQISHDVKKIQRGDYGGSDRTGMHRFAAAEIHDMAASVRALRHHLIQKQIYENDLNIAKQSAEQANRAKSDFLANISHELRTPLNAIIGFSEMIMAQLFGRIGNERYLAYAGDINRSGAHLLGLINDILDISRIEAGKLELKIDAVDMAEAIDAVVTLMQPLLEEKNIALSLSLADDLPRVAADSQRVHQILINLLSNAVKFTNPGGKVAVSAVSDGENDILLTIADTGIGIAPGDIDRILRPFEQIENAFTRQHEGSGLGLPITLALVERHGGTMRIDSAPGEGTRVAVRLPVTASADASAPADEDDMADDAAIRNPAAAPLKRIA